MGRIEEIKERLQNSWPETWGTPEECAYWLQNNIDFIIRSPIDIEYLLSRLQIAEEALVKISLDSTYSEDAQPIALKALEQIQKE